MTPSDKNEFTRRYSIDSLSVKDSIVSDSLLMVSTSFKNLEKLEWDLLADPSLQRYKLVNSDWIQADTTLYYSDTFDVSAYRAVVDTPFIDQGLLFVDSSEWLDTNYVFLNDNQIRFVSNFEFEKQELSADSLVFRINTDCNDNGTWDEGELSKTYDEFVNPSISANFTFLLGAASVEYVMPLLQDLELSAGALMGLGRAGMAINQTSSNPKWSQVFSNVYGSLDSTTGALYYGVTADEYENPTYIRPGPVPGLLRDVSSAFFNFQPYVAVKWQFLERLGLRISVGFNKGTVSAGSWKLNGKTTIDDSPTSALAGVAFRTMFYIGL